MNEDLKFVYRSLEQRFEERNLLKPADLEPLTGYDKRTIYNKLSDGTFDA